MPRLTPALLLCGVTAVSLVGAPAAARPPASARAPARATPPGRASTPARAPRSAGTRPAVSAAGATTATTPSRPAAGPSAAEVAAAARLVGAVLVQGRALETLEALTDHIGPRVSGTAAYRRAVAWAVSALRAAGLKRVRREGFMVSNGWERGVARARLLAPIQRPLHVASVAWSPSTRGTLRGEVVHVEGLDRDTLKPLGRLRGRLVLVDGAFFSKGRFDDRVAEVAAAYPLLARAGVTGILWAGSRPNNVLKVTSVKYPNARVGALPAADIGLEDARLIERLLRRGPVRLELSLVNRVSGPTRVDNVVAELRGRERPDEWILVGAHLDSWDGATGTQDNATGVAMVIEAARAIAAGPPPRRSLRFVLWGGEEQGLLGARAWAHARADELNRVVAVLNTDYGAGAPRGWAVGERPDVADALGPLVRGLLGGLGATEIARKLTCSSDHAPFAVRGVPTLNLVTDGSRYASIHHLDSDTVDKVEPGNLAAGAAVVAVTAWALAERAERPGRRLSRAEVEKILGEGELKRCLRLQGWPP